MDDRYDQAFFALVNETGERSAAAVVPWLCSRARPKSVLDVGCGQGIWARAFLRQGVESLVAVDGVYVDKERLHIPRECFRSQDLAQPLVLERRFDLAVCLEVAEHLDECYADVVVGSIDSHTDTVLFSAAIPKQEGTDHRNEQWPSYWIEKFEARGFSVVDVLRPVFWYDERVAFWYRQNLLLFIRMGSRFADELSIATKDLYSFGGRSIVHPKLWIDRASRHEHCVGAQVGPRARLKGFLPAVGRAIARRFAR